MLLKKLKIDRKAFEAGTGWTLKREGACKGDVCIPLSKKPGKTVDVERIASEMGLPLAAEPEFGLWALGPESVGARALTTAEAPDFSLPDLSGREFRLSSLRGQKVLLFAWAPY